MGLDTVELVMAFEEKFEITIPDEDAEKIVTVRDVIDYVYARVNHADAKTCLTQRAFYRLRRALQSELSLARPAVRPATRLTSIVPVEDRRAVWERLRSAVGASAWPDLNRSRTTVLANAAGSIAVGAAVWVAVAAATPDPGYAFFLSAAATLATATLLTRATEHLRVNFGRPETVGQLSEYLLANEMMKLQPTSEDGWSREQVRAAVRAIVINQLNVEPTFSDDASFVDDLGAD